MSAEAAEVSAGNSKLEQAIDVSSKGSVDKTVVIVGNGPVGMRAAADILNRSPDTPVIIYGEEAYLPYNRVKLSSWLAGEVRWNDLLQPLRRPFGTSYEERIGYRVDHIDVDAHTIKDSSGLLQPYARLILAVGSRAFVPPVPGMDADGVYTLRNMDDAHHLMARRVRSHHTVVIGGGLLGLESARAMQTFNTRVTIIEHADRLMALQLDERASALLQDKVESLGMDVVLGDGIKMVQGSPRVTSICLHSGRVIECDTLIVATGIRSNIDLARQTGLSFNRGILVNDQMQTSNEDIYAIGECAEHRKEVYGLVAPGLEQASVAVSHIVGKSGEYTGSIVASRLKVVGTHVFSMGPMGEDANPLEGKKYSFVSKDGGTYRAVLLRHNRLIGAVGMGQWDESVRLQSAISETTRLYPWDLWRFRFSGRLWSEKQGNAVSDWPAATIVCQCMGVNRGCLSDAIAQGTCSVDALREKTGASSVCGSCKPLVQELVGSTGQREAVSYSKALLWFSLLTLLIMAAVALFPSLPYANSVQPVSIAGTSMPVQWDELWRNGFYKQVSGFTVLGLSVLAVILSLRKRWPRFHGVGRFDTWRLLHVIAGMLTLGVLMIHTGFRLGHGLNQYLMLTFTGLVSLGAVASAVLAFEHRLRPSLATGIRRQSIWLHILLFWPIPVLLGWHVFKGYWY